MTMGKVYMRGFFMLFNSLMLLNACYLKGNILYTTGLLQGNRPI